MSIPALKNSAGPQRAAELDQLGDEIAELSAHLDAATARLLELIREFDARGGGTPGSTPARRGSPGAWGWSRGQHGSGCGWRGRWQRCRAWRRH